MFSVFAIVVFLLVVLVVARINDLLRAERESVIRHEKYIRDAQRQLDSRYSD